MGWLSQEGKFLPTPVRLGAGLRSMAERAAHESGICLSHWIKRTVADIKALQAQLGHTDSRLTLSVYTQPMPEAQRQIARKVAGFCSQLLPNRATQGRPPEV